MAHSITRRIWLYYLLPLIRKINRYSERQLSFLEWIGITTILFLLLGFVFYGFVFYFQNQRIAVLRNEWMTYEAILKKRPDTVIRVVSTRKFQRLSPRVVDIEYFKISKKEAFELLEATIVSHNLRVLELGNSVVTDNRILSLETAIMSNTSAMGVMRNYGLRLVLVGGYADIGEYLFSIYELPIATEWVSVVLRPYEEPGRTVAEIEMGLHIYDGDSL